MDFCPKVKWKKRKSGKFAQKENGLPERQPVINPLSRSGRVDLVITCTFQHRWVASETLYRFQLPAADGSREACEPRPEMGIPYNEMWVKKRSITHPAGHAEYRI